VTDTDNEAEDDAGTDLIPRLDLDGLDGFIAEELEMQFNEWEASRQVFSPALFLLSLTRPWQ